MVTKGSFIRVDYEAVTDDGQLFDTTSKEVAKKHNAYREDIAYEPLPLVVGAGRALAGFDKALQEANVGEDREVTLPPSEAFGEKDGNKFQTLPLKDFQKRDVQPYPGLRIRLDDNKTGTIVSVTPGRVRIDLNHPFAGKSITYRFKVVEEITDVTQKVKALLDMDYGQGRAEGFGVKVEGDAVTLDLPDSCKYDQRWFVAKYRLVSDLRAYCGMKTVRFVESYTTEAPPAPVQAPEAEKKELVEEEMV